MSVSKILNQGSSNNCANFALSAILQHKGIIVPDELFLIDAPYIGKLEKLFKEAGLIKKFLPLNTQKITDIFLKKGEWLITSTARGNFNNPPNVTFDGKSQHFFVLCQDLGDKYKCINSWGDGWGEYGYFFINKSDYKYLLKPRRVIIK